MTAVAEITSIGPVQIDHPARFQCADPFIRSVDNDFHFVLLFRSLRTTRWNLARNPTAYDSRDPSDQRVSIAAKTSHPGIEARESNFDFVGFGSGKLDSLPSASPQLPGRLDVECKCAPGLMNHDRVI